MKNLTQLLNQLTINDTISRQNDSFSKMGYVREQYILNEKVIENNENISEDDVTPVYNTTDKDEVTIKKIIDLLNKSNSGWSSKLVNFLTPVTDNLYSYIPVSIDYNLNKTEISNPIGIYNNNSGLKVFVSSRIILEPGGSNYSQNSYLTQIASVKYFSEIVVYFKTLSTAGKNKIANTILDYCNAIENILQLCADNHIYLSFLKLVGGNLIPVPTVNNLDVDVALEQIRYKGFCERKKITFNEVFTAEFIPFKQVSPLTKIKSKPKNKTILATDLFRENDLTCEIIDDTNLTITKQSRNFLFDVKTNPNPTNSGIVKIPKKDSYVFLKKTNNEQSFVEIATEYDSIDVNIDNGLLSRIKEYVANFKTDDLNLITGRDTLNTDLRGQRVNENELVTHNINKLLYDADNGSITMDEQIQIVGKNDTLIGIGRPGDDDAISTPFDDDIEELSNILEGDKKILTYLKDQYLLDENNDQYSLFKMDGAVENLDDIDDRMIQFRISEVILKFEQIDINSQMEYTTTDLATLDNDWFSFWENVVSLKKSIREYIGQNIKAQELPKLGYTTERLGAEYSKIIKSKSNIINEINKILPSISNKFGDTYKELVLGLITAKYYPYKGSYKDNSVTGVGAYKVLDFIYSQNTSLFNELVPLVKRINWKYTFDITRKFSYPARFSTKIPEDTLVSPEDATGLIINYVYLRFLMRKKVLNDLLIKQEDAKKNRTIIPLKVSLGDIMRDLLDALIGGFKLFKLNPSGSPTYIPGDGVNEKLLDNKLKIILNNTNNLLR